MYPAEILGPRIWTARVVNSSTAPITELTVQVVGLDANGVEVEKGITKASEGGIDRAMQRMIAPAIRAAMGAGQSSIGLSAQKLCGLLGSSNGKSGGVRG